MEPMLLDTTARRRTIPPIIITGVITINQPEMLVTTTIIQAQVLLRAHHTQQAVAGLMGIIVLTAPMFKDITEEGRNVAASLKKHRCCHVSAGESSL